MFDGQYRCKLLIHTINKGITDSFLNRNTEDIFLECFIKKEKKAMATEFLHISD